MPTIEQEFQAAVAHHQAGRFAEAVAGYQRLLVQLPDHPEILHPLGIATHQLGQSEAAVDLIRRAIARSPNVADFYNSLGEIQRVRGQLTEAIELIKTAIQIRPNFPEAYNNLGTAMQTANKFLDAEACYRHAISLNPNYANAYGNLGATLHEQRKHSAAIEAYDRALQLYPNHLNAIANKGRALLERGQLADALTLYRRAIALEPTSPSIHSYILLPLHYDQNYRSETVFAEHREWARRHAQALYPNQPVCPTDPNPNRRLRIGYVSPDLRNHPVSYFLEPILVSHNHEQFEIFCYCDSRKIDAMTQRLKSYTDHWRETVHLSDQQLFDQIRSDGIDILIDLTGHTAHHRLLVFAHRPAPVQITYLGYPNTTGLATMDYWITDPIMDPPGQSEPFATEKIIRLPEVFTCYQPPAEAPPVDPPPSVSAGHITFGSFNDLTKLTDAVVELWSKVLHAVPNSRLVLQANAMSDPPTRDLIASRFLRFGIDARRLELRGHEEFTDYLRSFRRMDIALDPFPFNGHTTTMHALWMGVPLVTLAGTFHVSRRGATILTNAGLADLIASTPQQYVQIAADLANNPQRLAELRSTMRDRLRASALTDAKRFTKDFEALLRQVWQQKCKS